MFPPFPGQIITLLFSVGVEEGKDRVISGVSIEKSCHVHEDCYQRIGEYNSGAGNLFIDEKSRCG